MATIAGALFSLTLVCAGVALAEESIRDDAAWHAYCERSGAAAALLARLHGPESIDLCDGRRVVFSGAADTDLDGRVDEIEWQNYLRLRERYRLDKSNRPDVARGAPPEYKCPWLYYAQQLGIALKAMPMPEGLWELRPAWEFTTRRSRRAASQRYGPETNCLLAERRGHDAPPASPDAPSSD